MTIFGCKKHASSSGRIGWTVLCCLALVGLGTMGSNPSAQAQQSGVRSRSVLVEEVRNDSPSFYVRVGVDHPDHVYRVGEEMRVTVSSERAGYLYLLYLDAAGKISCLFPNKYQLDNAIPAGQNVVTVPGAAAPFRLRIGEPVGQEALKAIVSLKALAELDLKQIAGGTVELKNVKAAYVEAKNSPGDWAEHNVEITTKLATGVIGQGSTVQGQGTAGQNQGSQNQGSQGPLGKKRRVGVFIGISNYVDPQIRSLKISHKDAQAMAEVMQRNCSLSKAILLTNEQATRGAIEQVFRSQLPVETSPGDEVFVFWSGHGGRCASQDPKQKDGYAEYLVPHDGRLDDNATIKRTMLLDETFGRWMQELDGRRILVVLDTCYSAGQHDRAKAIGSPVGDKVFFDFFNFRRTKDLGQRELAMLASSKANQVSFERKEGDLSAMTYFLVQRLNTGGQVTLADAYQAVKIGVPRYVEENFPGSTQTPILIDDTTPPLFVRP